MNKAGRGDGIPAELESDESESAALNVVNRFGKLSSGHRTGKCQSSFESQRKAMPKNAQTNVQVHSFHMLAR